MLNEENSRMPGVGMGKLSAPLKSKARQKISAGLISTNPTQPKQTLTKKN